MLLRQHPLYYSCFVWCCCSETEEEINLVVSSFLQVIKALNISEEANRNIRQDYFNMIMLDFIVNNVDRNKNNYGLIIILTAESLPLVSLSNDS